MHFDNRDTNMRPSFLENQRQFVLFGGKGGVGKTTSAVACALVLAEEKPDKKIILVSTDPAHSLGDSLDQKIGDQTVPIRGTENLFARETNAERLLAEFKNKNSPILEKIANRGTYFDKEDIRGFLELSLPGMDEFMAVLELMELVKTRQYDIVIMDTAPTGHTIRLLELPTLLQEWVGIMDLMMQKHRLMAETFSRRRYQPDECDRWLEAMADDARQVERLFQDAEAMDFVIVTIPEEMAIAESERLAASLKKYHIPVRNLLVNHVVSQNAHCPFCEERHEEQAASLKKIASVFSDLHITEIPQLPCEVRGLEALRRFARFFVGDARPTVIRPTDIRPTDIRPTDTQPTDTQPTDTQPTDTQPTTVDECDKPSHMAESESAPSGLPLLIPTAHLVLIGGKGGVGKSTLAAATAIKLAAQHPNKKVLIFSTDPAHSLSDSFSQQIGTKITTIEGIANLSAQEIDAPALLGDFKRRYRESIDDIFNSFLSGSDMNVKFEQDVMERLLDLSPPGIDEVMAMIEVMELMEGRAFDIFVLDTAPTGHLLRFLEMPEIADDWLSAAMNVILKYQGLVRLGSAAGMVMKYSSQVQKLRQKLLNPAETEIIVVTIPEIMGVVEMNRLLMALREFKIACRQIAINMVTPAHACPFCLLKREEEQRYIREVIAQCSPHRVACIPRLPHPVHGLANLREFKQIVWD